MVLGGGRPAISGNYESGLREATECRVTPGAVPPTRASINADAGMTAIANVCQQPERGMRALREIDTHVGRWLGSISSGGVGPPA